MRSPRPLHPLPARNGPQAPGESRHTRRQLSSAPHQPQAAKLPAASPLEQVRFNLLPGNNSRGIALIAGHAPVELRRLLLAQTRCLRFNVLPQSVQQLEFLRYGQTADLAGKRTHTIEPRNSSTICQLAFRFRRAGVTARRPLRPAAYAQHPPQPPPSQPHPASLPPGPWPPPYAR